MFAAYALTALFAFAAPLVARADVTPNEPGPGDVFNAGTTCKTTWFGDSNSTTVWKNMAIELMSGSNLGMVHLTTVATNQDGTVDGSFQFPCPQVNPFSAIYFFQFSSPLATDKTWTTRFTIASPTGQVSPPANMVQPGSNDPIPWGVGTLVDPSTAVAAPNFGSVSANGTSTSAPVVTPATTSSSSSVASITLSTSSTDSSSPTNAPAPTNAPTTQSNTTSAAFAVSLDGRVWMSVAALAFAALLW